MSVEHQPVEATTGLRDLVMALQPEDSVIFGRAHQFAEILAHGTYGDLSTATTKVIFNGEQIDVEIDDGRTGAGLWAHISFQPDGTPIFVNTAVENGFLRELYPEEIDALITDFQLLSGQAETSTA